MALVHPILMAHSHCTGLGPASGMMGLYIMHLTVHITQGQGQGMGTGPGTNRLHTHFLIFEPILGDETSNNGCCQNTNKNTSNIS